VVLCRLLSDLQSSARATKEHEAQQAREGAARRIINGAKYDIALGIPCSLVVVYKVLVVADQAGPNDETLGRRAKEAEGIASNQCQRV
jgi:hypothetical protein